MDSLPPPILEALKFESSNEANGTVFDDEFYKTPDSTGKAAAGTVLKIEENVDSNVSIRVPIRDP